jgi:molybdopterin synthase catalytic subunit
VKLFAGYRDKVGASGIELDLPDDASLGDLAREMVRRHPALISEPADLVAAVNQEFRGHDHTLAEGDEVALIPPVSGGAERDHVRCSR